jgi:CheY-like chemotaxis protein
MKTILIVDDEFSIVEAVAEIVAFAGYKAVTAANGQAGLESARTHRPDLILLDFMMPALDGLQVLAKLREDPKLQRVKVVMMTAAPQGISANTRRWDALLIKPFDASDLTGTITRLIGPP